MSCNLGCCDGFIMRSFLPFGSLVVTRGFGSCGDEEIPPAEGPQIPVGIGRRVRVNVAAADAPTTIIRYPGRKTGKCEG